MARNRINNVEGDKDEARSGWKSRRRKTRRARMSEEDRIAGNAARAAIISGLSGDTDFNETVQPGAPAADDYITNLSDKDLAAYYEQLHGRKPNGKAKRVNIEAAVRKAEIDRKAAKDAADAEAAAEETGEEPDDEEFRIDRDAADDDQAEDDV